jgi:hypothetical protein
VDLQTDAAVGAKNLRRGAGSERSRPGRIGDPEEESKSMGVVGAQASMGRKPEDREVVKTAWRESRTE